MSEIVIAIKRTCKCVLPEGAPDILLLDTDYYCPVCKRQCETFIYETSESCSEIIPDGAELEAGSPELEDRITEIIIKDVKADFERAYPELSRSPRPKDKVGNITDAPPSQPGWYATLHSWDSNEGMFPGAHFWTGSEWEPETSAGILYWPILFASEDEARKYAEDHDPDQPKDRK